MTSGQGKVQLLSTIGLVMCLFLAGTPANVSFAQETSVAPLTADQVVRRMVERNEQRAQSLESYRGTRTYNLEYHGLASKSATLVVAMTYRRPDEKKLDRKSTRLNSSHGYISYAVFCLKKKKRKINT